MLTSVELRSAMEARCFDPLLWGSIGRGLTPEGRIASIRGAWFRPTILGQDAGIWPLVPSDERSSKIAFGALLELSCRLGFRHVQDYLAVQAADPDLITDRLWLILDTEP